MTRTRSTKHKLMPPPAPHTHTHRILFSISQLLAWNIFIINRIIEAACAIIIQDISAFALVTFLSCGLQLVDGARVELMEAKFQARNA